MSPDTPGSGLPGEILVFAAAAGAGHVSAAEALVATLAERGESARHEEVLRHTNPLFRRLYADLYLELVNRRPQLLGWMYDALDKPWQFQKRRLALDRLNTGPLKRLLRLHPPRLALCTHVLPAEIQLHLSIVQEVRSVRGRIQVAAICGKNARLERKLRELPAG